MSLSGATDKEKLDTLNSFTFKEQAIWFLNSYWHKYQNEAEQVWKFVHKAAELNQSKKADGSDLDEFEAHRFLEHFHESMTVAAMREKLRSTGAIQTSQVGKRVPLTYILVFKYDVDWKELVNAVQGTSEEIEKAQKMLEEVNKALAEASKRAADAAASEQAAVTRQKELAAAKAELEAALNELKAQEEARDSKTAELTRRSEEGGVVQKNKAKAELAQHLAEDPLPLRKAKITQEASVKKADRAAQAAKEAADRAAADREAADEAVAEAEKRVEEAGAYLEKAKRSVKAQASIWWLERELHEAKAFLPTSKGGYKRPA